MCSIFLDAIREGKWNIFDSMQNNIFFQPTQTTQEHVYDFPGQTFREVFWKIDEKDQLHGIHFVVNINQPSEKGLVLCFHGNSGTLVEWGTLGAVFVNKGYDFLMVDYRNFGKSIGELTEENVHKDAMLAYKYGRKFYKPKKIVIHGISIGTAVATRLAATVPCKALVLQTPFMHLRDIAKAHVTLLPEFVCHWFKFQFESDKYITKVKCPIYGIHSRDDTLIPYTSATKLFDKLKNRKDCILWLVDDVGHSVELSPLYLLFLDTIYN